ncbi:MAG: FIVAR domain-containing protein, partial [Treponema sp.]|nr:FIVAR domain-containing protein [Treponema sp.]
MKLSTRLRRGILGMTLVFGVLFAGCGDSDDNPPSPPQKADKTELTAKIAEAKTAKAGVLTGEQAADVPQGTEFVSTDDMDAFEKAIGAAETVNANGSATQAQVSKAVTDLTAAITAFNNVEKQTGSKTSGFSLKHLSELIEGANGVKENVASSKDGTDQPSTVEWVTQDALTTFNEAIEAAEAITVTGDELDAKYTALAAAITAFTDAKHAGKARLIITGLPSSLPTGASISVILAPTADREGISQRPRPSEGSGTVKDGSATVRLWTRRDDQSQSVLWTDTGSWFVGFQDISNNIFFTKAAQSFGNATVTVTVEFSAFQKFTPTVKDPKGEIKGSVTFTDVPNPKPEVTIQPWYYITGQDGGGESIDGLGLPYPVSISDGSFTISYTEEFLSALDALQGKETITLGLGLSIGSGGSSYFIYLPQKEVKKSDLSDATLNVGNVGSVSLASVKLSGTVTVNDGGQPVPKVIIMAEGDGFESDQTLYTPAVAGAAWSLTIPARDGAGAAVTLSVSDGYGNEGQWRKQFEASATGTASVTNQPISGITLDVGDIN